MRVTLVHKDTYIPDFDFKDVSQVPMELASALGAEVNSYVPKKYDSAPTWIQPTGSRWKTLLRILLSGKKTDVLVLFHIEKFSILAAWLYKISNPRGFVYVKGDFNDHSIENLAMLHKKIPRLINTLLSRFDVISYENINHEQRLKKIIPKGTALVHVRNCPSPDVFENKAIAAKKNTFIAVGRVWYDELKRYSILLKALLLSDIPIGYNIRIIGETEGGGRNFLTENEEVIKLLRLKEVDVSIEGPILNRKELSCAYGEAFCMCITSNTKIGAPLEGSPLIVTEAMHNGCLLVSTKAGTIPLDYPKEGLFLCQDNPEDIANKINDAIRWNESTPLAEKEILRQKISDHCSKTFKWDVQLESITSAILRHYDK